MATQQTSARPRWLDYLAIARPDHWFKNVFIVPGLLLARFFVPAAERQTDAARRLRVAAAPADAAGLLLFGQYPALPRGRYAVWFDADWDAIAPDAPARLEVAADHGRRILCARTLSGTATGAPPALDIEISARVEDVEPRVHFGGSGVLRLRRVRFIETERLGTDASPDVAPDRASVPPGA